MKVFRDIIAAILVGIMGGFLVTTISYYNKHKDGGLLQTALAVTDSFEKVSEAYGGEDNVYSKLDNIELTDEETADRVLEVFENAEENEETVTTGALLKAILGKENETNGDILAMDGVDGAVNEGMPYSGILRFHVRANSDSEEDQALKMAVKEDVVTMLKPLLANCKDVEESKNVIVSNFSKIYETAVNTIVEQGYDYTVKVFVTEEEFPAKTYGDLTFPAGDYQALRIDIGAAKGQNWWCVMYPPLCFIDESTAVVSKEGKELLKENMTQEEYKALFLDKETEIKTDWKIADWWKNLKKDSK